MEPRYEVFSERGQKIAPKKVHQKICEAYVRELSKQKVAEFSPLTTTSKTLGLGHFLALFWQNINTVVSQEVQLPDAAKKFNFQLNGAENGRFKNEGDKKVEFF